MSNAQIDLSGKAALVTGAGRGIGLCIARALADRGASVLMTARKLPSIEGEAAALQRQGFNVQPFACDVTRYADVEASVHRAKDLFGRLDILVNNAGVIDPIARIADSDPEAWSDAIETNVKGVYYGLRAAIPVMEAQGEGVIVNMSSGAASSALEGWSHYCASKIAAKKLTECAHKEVGERGVRVVGLSPGTVATEMMSKVRASGVNPVSKLDWSAHIPPEWAAEAVVFLCGPEGAEFAGTDFSIKTPEGRRRVGLPEEGAPD